MKLLSLSYIGTLLALADAAAYLQTTLANGATMHQFHLIQGWEKDQSVVNGRQSIKTVMQKMNTKGPGMFTAVILEGAETSVQRSTAGNGLQSALEFAKSQPSTSTFLLTNGGFFLNDKSPKNDYSVGPISGQGAQYVPVPEVYRDVFGRFAGDDGSFLESGPTLGKPIDQSEDRFQYFEKGSDKVMSKFAKLPGGVATANQNNERLAIVKMGPRHKIVFAYTSVRDHGVRINDLRALIDAFLQGFLGKGIAQAVLALNLDGGGSIFVGWQANGVMKPIVCGNMGLNQKPGFRSEKEMTIRPVPNFIRHSFGPTSAGTPAGRPKPSGDAGAAKKTSDKSAPPPAAGTKTAASRPATPTGGPTSAKSGASTSGSSTSGKGGATTPGKPKPGRKSPGGRRRAVYFEV